MRDNFKKHREKGVVLIFSLFVVVLLSASIGILYMRAINETRLTQRNSDSFKAFTEAEAGVAFAYTIERANNFSWYTHLDRNTRGNPSPPGTVITIASIDPLTGYLQATGRRFSIKTYPEVIDTSATGVVIIHSQATVNNITRTVERRLGQASAYQYFFFFPADHTFDTATFDGRNYGGIHVNGDIYFSGDPKFYYLTKLICGSNVDGKGYIYRKLKSQFSDLTSNLGGEVDFFNTVASTTDGLSSSIYMNMNYHFEIGTTDFKTGGLVYNSATNQILEPNPVTAKLYSYLNQQWSFQKYAGSNTIPIHYRISANNLKNLALKETSGNKSSEPYNLLRDDTYTGSLPKDITMSDVTLGTASEEAMFKKINNLSEPLQTEAVWNEFWNNWKLNHADDYADKHSAGAFTESTNAGGVIKETALNRDWERRFFIAATHWSDSNNDGIPTNVNREWWQDMTYGTDRADLSNDLADAQVEDNATGLAIEGQYFLNTQKQASAWDAWLETNNLNQAGENQTLVKDKSQGGEPLLIGEIISQDKTDYNQFVQKAKEGGIYIGAKTNEAYLNWLKQRDAAYQAYKDANNFYNSCWQRKRVCTTRYRWGRPYRYCYYTYVNVCSSQERQRRQRLRVEAWEKYSKIAGNPPSYYAWPDPIINDCVWEETFYNALHPARNGVQYQPSDILKIDLYALKQKIDEQRPGFNGIVYIDLDNYLWGGSRAPTDPNAVGVILVNGERLPTGGLSVVTPHNVYIKGNYNLDPYGDYEKFRKEDNFFVIWRTTNLRKANYGILDERFYGDQGNDFYKKNSLKWQPAEIITRRAVYTLSSGFSQPKTMPLINYDIDQYYDQYYGYTPANVLDHPFWGKVNATWMPSTITENISPWSQKIADWIALSGETPTWSKAWVEGSSPSDTTLPSGLPRWGAYSWSDNYVYKFGDKSFVRQDLKYALYDKINSSYKTEYAYKTDSLNTYQVANPATSMHIYNSAIVTPYSTEGYNLEQWGSSTRKIINGAFIQLPDSADYKDPIPATSYASSNRYSNPVRVFNYETRFGKQSSQSERPRSGLTFGAGSSWREIRNDRF